LLILPLPLKIQNKCITNLDFIKTKIMKRTFLISILAVATIFTAISCATVRGGGGGCKMNQGFVGYGGH
jgi:predicted small secreted protein